MNAITFNDGIERAIASYPQRDIVKVFGGWQKAPLFDYVTTYEHERSLLTYPDIEALEMVEMPFEKFRLAVAETAVPWIDGEHEVGRGIYRTNIAVARFQSELWLLTEIRELWDRHEPGTPHLPLPIFMLIGNLRHDPNGRDQGAYFYNASINIDGKWHTVDNVIKSGLQQLVSGALGALAAFLFDANMPTTHIATVRPSKQGKSVEWMRARTHYTLICHGHPANKKDVTELQRVAVDRNEEIKRMSHDRRGHWRTYRHPRYTYARGSTRWIKQAWCGPKEWMDAGGRQVYRILEPVGAERLPCELTAP